MRSSLTIVALLLLVPASPALAQQEVPGPLRFTTAGSSFIRLDAAHQQNPEVCPALQPRNLHAAYSGTIEIGRRANGLLYLVAEMDFPTYLSGIAEVPTDWPVEALKAQVVAARTYAISHMDPSTALARELRFNLCATDACQVYRGRNISHGAWGERWREAVASTSGEILQHGGRPADTFYFSTSNGRTYSNAEVWGGNALPYLQPTGEEHDGESPVRTWTVRMPLEDLAVVLRRAGVWGEERVASVGFEGDTIRVSGGGRTVTLSSTEFRFHLNSEAPCLTPKRYPTPSRAGRNLPQVVPSRWFSLRQEGSSIVLEGQGWGHGVGMVQWGLHGKAKQGWDHQDMLAHYYGGLRPEKRDEPGMIRVGLASDLTHIDLEPKGTVRLSGMAPSVWPEPVRITSGEAGIVVSRVPKVPSLLGLTRVSHRVTPEEVVFSFILSSEARVRVDHSTGDGEPSSSEEVSLKAGEQTYTWDLTDLPEGVRRATLVAGDGVDVASHGPIEVPVAGRGSTPSPEPADARSPPGDPSPRLLPIALASAGAAALALAGIWVLRRRSSNA